MIELEALCLALTNGSLLLLSLEERQWEEVGALEGGIAAAALSPDGELLATASGDGKLLLMTKAREGCSLWFSSFFMIVAAARSARC